MVNDQADVLQTVLDNLNTDQDLFAWDEADHVILVRIAAKRTGLLG
jgi:hypothetical protein